MVNNQQYDSHVGRPTTVARVFHSLIVPPHACERGGEGTRRVRKTQRYFPWRTCRVKQTNVSTTTKYGIKPRIQGCPRGSVRIGGKIIREKIKKKSTA